MPLHGTGDTKKETIDVNTLAMKLDILILELNLLRKTMAEATDIHFSKEDSDYNEDI